MLKNLPFILASTVSGWLGDEGGTAPGGFGPLQNKIMKTGGSIIALIRNISIAIALISLATGLLLISIGTSKSKDEGKEKIKIAAVALILISCVFGVASAILSAI